MFAPKGSAFAPTPEVLPVINSDVGSTSRRGVWELFSVNGCGVVRGGGICGSADQAVSHAEGDGMPAVARAESSEQSAGVCFHGVHGQEQVTTDFPVGLSAADSAQDLQFSFGGWVGPHVGAQPRGTGVRLGSDGLMWWR